LQLSFKQSSASYSGGSGYQEGHQVVKGRPRANTSPWLPSLFGGDHQSWFNDPRFDGSFPSRVLPFLYLGNLWVFLFLFSFWFSFS
jgi:dual specificity MAP kinase phosphatase